MRVATTGLLLGTLIAGDALAEACYVSARTSSDAIQEVAREFCYEFVGMAEGDIDWSCNNENNNMLNSDQRKVARCAGDGLGRCEAALTQATMSNYRAGDDDMGEARPAVPNDAKVITHYYQVGDLEQARLDCESAGGTWRDER